MESVEKFPVQRVTRDGKRDAEDLVTAEFPLTIILNNRELVTLLCSPSELDYLAIGFLSSEGLLKGKDEIKKVVVDDVRGVVRVETTKEEKELADLFKRFITSGCGRGASFYSAADIQQTKVESKITISAAEIFSLVKEFQHRSLTYRATGGVHSAALCDAKSILLFSEDIGRHNAVDKIFGRCILQGIPTDNHIILTSGRISSEILFKVAKRNIPVLVSISAPTNLGVKLAADLGITLIGFVRGEKMNAYANSWRITVGK
ncbi:MAG: formate dehydrogenase accessory sulfurtransferase FdhD [Chloroflexi bacterium]|nr:formate dehydrogenase accessory sulfurtransferase FdhD [Chloroflexota bacterium]